MGELQPLDNVRVADVDCRRKATSLIRQFNNYTPIISMTSNAQPREFQLAVYPLHILTTKQRTWILIINRV